MYVNITSVGDPRGKGKRLWANSDLSNLRLKRSSPKHLGKPAWHIEADGSTMTGRSDRWIEIQLTPEDISGLLAFLAENKLLSVVVQTVNDANNSLEPTA